MPRRSSLVRRPHTFLPRRYWAAHELCFFIHDVMVTLLASGQRASAFQVRFELSGEEQKALQAADNVLEWLAQHRTSEERTAVLVAVMFPAMLSDMLHCIYEALETSRKAKLNLSFILLRKPIQESLYVLEALIADRADFAKKLTEDPIRLWSQGAGGREAHAKNVAHVLAHITDDGRFDADYIAQLRYDKSAEDGFDGVCNKAIHLFTSHKAIATPPMDINFIFSDWQSKETQWSFLYSRLPYLLSYTYQIVEFVCAGITPTAPAYLDYLRRRLTAHTMLWGRTIEDRYREPRVERYVAKCAAWLAAHCEQSGHRAPNERDLVRMSKTGGFPGETGLSGWLREQRFQEAAERSDAATRSKLTPILRRLGLLNLK